MPEAFKKGLRIFLPFEAMVFKKLLFFSSFESLENPFTIMLMIDPLK